VEIGETLYVSKRADWRRWLRAHHNSKNEIWLVYYKSGSGKPRIPYNDAVEEALCFGWIDSTVKKIDHERFAQRFSPRKPGAAYSPANQERLRSLVAEGKVIPEVRVTLGDISPGKLEIAQDILAAIKADKEAWKHFRKLPEPYRRIRIGFIEGARNRPAEFQKRLRYFIRMTAKNKMYGFGGIEKYYGKSDG
jgi:uncharacterized protein YdeI (YjbR/CyaY-like superfamily)